MKVKTGIDVLLEGPNPTIRGMRVGVVVHPASVRSDLEPSAEGLARDGRFRLVSLFGPQHGARGEKQDNMIESDSYRDPELGIPVYSLYSDTRKPSAEMMGGLDVLLYDLQDVGTRVYTFIHTMAYCMEACAQYGKKMIILDRPNPIGGEQLEGNLLDPAFRSFVGLYPIPMRHGMTAGEMALLLNSEYGIGCELDVVPMVGWRRSMWYDQTGLPWVMPSPNMPTLETATVYPGMVLIEGTDLSEGRGTTRPFELVGAPYISGRRLAMNLNSLSLPGVRFRATTFEPTFQKHAGTMCEGVQLHVQNRLSFESYLVGLSVIAAVRNLYPGEFRWRRPPYEYEHEKMPIEILCGSREVIGAIESGAGPQELRAIWLEDVEGFRRVRANYLLYQ